MRQVTLLFLLRNAGKGRQLLLAMKKRGFGAGKWNGVGGKVETGETIMAAAIRECQEEIGVTPRELTRVGELAFSIQDAPEHTHAITIFTAVNWQGEPRETDEMRPVWFTADTVPYDEMWAADRLWLPHVLAGEYVRGTIVLDRTDTILHAGITAGIVQLKDG